MVVPADVVPEEPPGRHHRGERALDAGRRARPDQGAVRGPARLREQEQRACWWRRRCSTTCVRPADVRAAESRPGRAPARAAPRSRAAGRQQHQPERHGRPPQPADVLQAVPRAQAAFGSRVQAAENAHQPWKVAPRLASTSPPKTRRARGPNRNASRATYASPSTTIGVMLSAASPVSCQFGWSITCPRKAQAATSASEGGRTPEWRAPGSDHGAPSARVSEGRVRGGQGRRGGSSSQPHPERPVSSASWWSN